VDRCSNDLSAEGATRLVPALRASRRLRQSHPAEPRRDLQWAARAQGTFVVADKRPLVAIIGPTNGQVLAAGASPQFAAAAYDPEDGMLFGASLKWTSDRDGLVGQGLTPSLRALSSGDHFVTLTATDSQGNSVRTRVNVIVSRERPEPR